MYSQSQHATLCFYIPHSSSMQVLHSNPPSLSAQRCNPPDLGPGVTITPRILDPGQVLTVTCPGGKVPDYYPDNDIDPIPKFSCVTENQFSISPLPQCEGLYFSCGFIVITWLLFHAHFTTNTMTTVTYICEYSDELSPVFSLTWTPHMAWFPTISTQSKTHLPASPKMSSSEHTQLQLRRDAVLGAERAPSGAMWRQLHVQEPWRFYLGVLCLDRSLEHHW